MSDSRDDMWYIRHLFSILLPAWQIHLHFEWRIMSKSLLPLPSKAFCSALHIPSHSSHLLWDFRENIWGSLVTRSVFAGKNKQILMLCMLQSFPSSAICILTSRAEYSHSPGARLWTVLNFAGLQISYFRLVSFYTDRCNTLHLSLLEWGVPFQQHDTLQNVTLSMWSWDG